MSIRRAPITCGNPACRGLFRSSRPRRYCSKKCAAAVRTRESRRLAGRKGGLASGAKRRDLSAERIAQLVEGMTVSQAFRLGRRYGFMDLRGRLQKAHREGFAEGYEACITAMEAA